MTAFTFRPAVRENVQLLISVAGPSGSGKTFTALRLATGLARGKRFAFIDSEARRGLHYADRFEFDHGDLRAPFRPQAYLDAILAAEQAGYPVIVVDSASHEHAGEGGLLDWSEELLDGFVQQSHAKGDSRSDWQIRESQKMRSWIEPKMAHKEFVQKLLQLRAHLILCFRAEAKIDIVRENGKTVIKPKESLVGADGYVPIAEKNLPYEMTMSFLLMPDKPGVPKPIKLEEQHRPFVDLTQPLTERTGELLAAWAAGEKQTKEEPPMSITAVLEAIRVAETRDHLVELKKYVERLDGEEQKKARAAAKKRLDELAGGAMDAAKKPA